MRLVAVATAIVLTLAPSSSRADEPSPRDDETIDTAVPRLHLTLKDGSEFTGELVEKVPQDHVTLKLDDGSTRRFDWAEIQFKRAPPAAMAPVRPSAPASAPADMAHVSLRADSGRAELQRKTGQTTVVTYMATPHGSMAQSHDEDVWETVCVSPCEVDVEPSQLYRVGGDGIVGSPTFRLAAGAHTLAADTGSSIKRGFGWAFTVIGGISILTGVLVLVATPRTLPNCTINGCTQVDQSSSIYAWSLPFIGVGAVAFGAGLWMLLSAKTHVTVDDGDTDRARVHLGPFQVGAAGLVF